MRKRVLWILTILLFFSASAFGCQKTVPSPAVPSASPAATSPSSPQPSADTSAPTAPAPLPDDEPVRDASYREYAVTFPSRGAQVHATVVLPGATNVSESPAASPSGSAMPDASAMPETSPDSSAMPETSPETSAMPETSPDSSAMPETSPNGSPETTAVPNPGDGARDAQGDVPAPSDNGGAIDPMPISADVPDAQAGGYPLVVFLHGHGGERNENGGFTEIAKRLASYGIASVRFDFAGSGESEEAFTENSITTMKTDVMAAIDFVKSTYPIDRERIGVFGFDMGGRVALQVLAEKLFDFRAAVLLAPANSNDDWINLFGGQEEWNRYKTDAELNNHTTFTTLFGQVQDLSIQWFTDLESTDDPASAVGTALQDRVLILYADNDTTVSPETARKAAQSLGARTVALETGGHSYGFYAENTELLNRIADETARFFAETLGV